MVREFDILPRLGWGQRDAVRCTRPASRAAIYRPCWQQAPQFWPRICGRNHGALGLVVGKSPLLVLAQALLLKTECAKNTSSSQKSPVTGSYAGRFHSSSNVAVDRHW